MEITLYVIVLVLAFTPFVVVMLGPNLREDKPVARRHRSASSMAASHRTRAKMLPEGVGLPLPQPPSGAGGRASAPTQVRPSRRTIRPRFHRRPRGHAPGT
jgi:hypothetical protein